MLDLSPVAPSLKDGPARSQERPKVYIREPPTEPRYVKFPTRLRLFAVTGAGTRPPEPDGLPRAADSNRFGRKSNYCEKRFDTDCPCRRWGPALGCGTEVPDCEPPTGPRRLGGDGEILRRVAEEGHRLGAVGGDDTVGGDPVRAGGNEGDGRYKGAPPPPLAGHVAGFG